jgi:hypothetical protein
MYRPKLIYDTLFKCAWKTMQYFGWQQQVELGMVSVLHTWGQAMTLHPHLHCIVPGGGLDADKRWRPLKGNGKYLFCVKGLSKMFRAKYVAELRKAGISDKHLLNSLFNKNWVVYAKRRFGQAKHVIEYLGRYTHKVAISNTRLISVSENQVCFTYKDYKAGATKKVMTLTTTEFTRRFALHILPLRLVRIRHFGMLSSTSKRKYLAGLQQQFKVHISSTAPTKILLRYCIHCQQHSLVTISTFDKRGPPPDCLTAKQRASALS